MAIASTHIIDTRPGFLERFTAWLSGAAARYGERHPRMIEVRRLQALSDNELAARGLTRGQIVAHVFRDIY